MAKLSRSKQPEFDPHELADLILTPAVGTGVGSHLLRTVAAGQNEVASNTFVEQKIENPLAAVAQSAKDSVQPTVASFDSPTVLSSELSQSRHVFDYAGDNHNRLLPGDNATTVVKLYAAKASQIGASSHLGNLFSLWVTESGEILPESRVRRIRLAQDVLKFRRGIRL